MKVRIRDVLPGLGVALLAAARLQGLTVSITLDTDRVAPAQPIYYWISFHNDMPRDEYVVRLAMHVPAALEVVGPDGQRLEYVGGMARLELGPATTYKQIPAGETFVLVGDLTESHRVVQPGLYHLRLNYSNARPESFMEMPNYRRRRPASPIDPALIVHGPITSAEVSFLVTNTDSPVDELIAQQISRNAKGGLSVVIWDSADVILRSYANSAYVPAALATKINQLLSGFPNPPAPVVTERFQLAAHMINQLEANHGSWSGLPYLLARAVMLARDKQRNSYAEEWTAKLKSRYPAHPALIWLANQRAETGADRPTK